MEEEQLDEFNEVWYTLLLNTEQLKKCSRSLRDDFKKDMVCPFRGVYWKRKINKPRPVDKEDMEKIFQEAKQEQEKADLAFQDKHEQVLESLMPNLDSLNGVLETSLDTSTQIPIRKFFEPSRRGRKSKYSKLVQASEFFSGSFAEFSGIVTKVDRKNEGTVGFTIFGKESISDLNIKERESEE